MWTIPKEWPGATAWIIAGGPSLDFIDVTQLRGRRVIVVNSSYEVAPDFAQYLFFGDVRWWDLHHARPAMRAFKGRKVTCSKSAQGSGIHRVARVCPGVDGPGLVDDPKAVVSQRTSLQGAMNMAWHLGVVRMVLVAADMGRAPDGRSHHHLPHPWQNKPGNRTWDIQMHQLRKIAEPLKQRGVEVLNTSLASRIDWWPKVSFNDALNVG